MDSVLEEQSKALPAKHPPAKVDGEEDLKLGFRPFVGRLAGEVAHSAELVGALGESSLALGGFGEPRGVGLWTH